MEPLVCHLPYKWTECWQIVTMYCKSIYPEVQSESDWSLTGLDGTCSFCLDPRPNWSSGTCFSTVSLSPCFGQNRLDEENLKKSLEDMSTHPVSAAGLVFMTSETATLKELRMFCLGSPGFRAMGWGSLILSNLKWQSDEVSWKM